MMHEVVEIFSDGESGPLETAGLLCNNTATTTGAKNNTRGSSFTQIVDPDSRGPAHKKRVIRTNNHRQTADMLFTTSKSSSTRQKPSVSSGTSLWPFSRDESALEADKETACLKLVLELFPDISRTYIRELYRKYKEYGYADGPTTTGSKGKRKATEIDPRVIAQRITEDVLSCRSYPKHKSKTGDSADNAEAIWKEEFLTHEGDKMYFNSIVHVLLEAFPWVPLSYIDLLVCQKKSLYSAYLSLYASEHYDDQKKNPPYKRLPAPRGPSREEALMEIHAKKPKWGFKSQVNSAKSRLIKENEELQRKRAAERAEKLNEEEHRKAGSLIECQCCFSDVPSNRAIPCEGEAVHFFCYGCVKSGAESQIGQMKYEMKCFDMSDCKAGFSRSGLSEAVGPAIIAKLEALEQQAEIAKANIEGLEECPFCNFKAILPPIKEDREFRCQNPDCKKVSCRLCKSESHVPKSCEEAKKEKGLEGRHFVEEAMSDALIRTCSSCGVKLIKEFGCNKMTCPCGRIMCYLCKKDITTEKYNHFVDVMPNGVFMPNARVRPRGCTMNDETPAERDKEEVARAERAAISKIRAENPHLKEEDLRVDKDKDKTNARTRRATVPNNNMRPVGAPRMMPWPGPRPQPMMPMNVGPLPQAAPFPIGFHWNPYGGMPVGPGLGPGPAPQMAQRPFFGPMQPIIPPMPPAAAEEAAALQMELDAHLQAQGFYRPGFYGPPPVRRNLNIEPLGGRLAREARPDTPRLPEFDDRDDIFAPNRAGWRRGR
ncbi:hypothetical protein DTO195F2_7334 [Paecilomyces variotii]|nr:hypothetical protein DTO195F2_7334 [Paecilomyces variotii]KAJ9367892.1 hypothetical protein DTO282E5_7398 [Paecilomyces variotii]